MESEMAFEIKPWKRQGGELTVSIAVFSQRDAESQEINQTYGEGGALNADYRTVEAIAVASNLLGRFGLAYGADFVWKTRNGDGISFDFQDERVKGIAARAFSNALVSAGGG